MRVLVPSKPRTGRRTNYTFSHGVVCNDGEWNSGVVLGTRLVMRAAIPSLASGE